MTEHYRHPQQSSRPQQPSAAVPRSLSVLVGMLSETTAGHATSSAEPSCVGARRCQCQNHSTLRTHPGINAPVKPVMTQASSDHQSLV